ncbi:hypothetical protein NEOLEDRAFT_1220962 [Neolentinus lepideus HHB14362 ss-1]|uniref:Uncharacterized protein n=1 Tax=Neolentinus lepideus HHB14362 ss-1 TaxID=1314782 RepID=A0A165Q6N3_9AGAM|nr:hypothetical protein NEOLEDRAFT_1220962 [Neolentinus lepideus HHB14362 ss-1]
MRQVTKPGRIIAIGDTNFTTSSWYTDIKDLRGNTPIYGWHTTGTMDQMLDATCMYYMGERSRIRSE